MSKINLLLRSKKILVLVSGSMLIATVVLSIFASVKASEIADVDHKIAELELNNRELSEKLISKSSLSTASEESSAYGLGSDRNVIYLNREVEVASLR